MDETGSASELFASLSARATDLLAEAQRLQSALAENIRHSRRLMDELDELRVQMAVGDDSLRGVRLKELEAAAMLNALDAADGNRTHAARMLGVSVRTVQRKLKSLGWLDGAPVDGEDASHQRAS